MSLSHLKQIPCPSCGSEQTLRVSLMLAGTDASFTMCSVCEWKGWERDGQLIQLGSVLSLVASR